MNEAVVGTCGKRTRDHGLVHVVKQKVGPDTSRCRAQPFCQLRSASATRQAIDVEEGHGATFQTDPAARHEVG